jgi:hypothetical protein
MDSGADSHMTSTSGNLLSFQQLGFVGARSYISLFIYRHGSDIIYLLLYVDDIILTASSDALLHRVIDVLTAEFYWKDLGRLHHFLGVSVTKHDNGLFLSQQQYMIDILERVGMSDCKPCSTPVDNCAKLSSEGPLGPRCDSLSWSRWCTTLFHILSSGHCLCY